MILQIQPEQPDALHLLGLIAQQMGHHEAALGMIARAIQIQPTVTMYSNLGLVFDSLGKPDMAIASFQQAISMNPDDPDAYVNLGATLKDYRRLGEAEECFDKALKLKPDCTEAYFNLGMLMQARGRCDQAIELIRKGLVIEPSCAKAHALLGSIQMDLGQYEIARGEIEEALKRDPELPMVMTLQAHLQKMTSEDKGWLEKALRVQPSIRARFSEDAIALRFAIGKYYDDTKQYDAAFQSYAQANAIRRQKEGGLDHERYRKSIDSLISVFRKEVVQKRRDGASDSERPVFIVGMPRSGTSLIEQIVASHPDAFGAGELPFWAGLPEDKVQTAIASDFEPRFLREVAAAYESELQGHSASALRVVDKMPGNFGWVGLITTVFPRARIIHSQRNPLDTCLSIYFQNFNKGHLYATDLDDLAFYYKEYVRLMDHWRAVLPPDRFIEIPYEALTDDQEGWSRKIVAFLGLEWSERCLEFYKTERKVGTASNWQVRQKVYKSSKARWRNYEKHLGPLLALQGLERL